MTDKDETRKMVMAELKALIDGVRQKDGWLEFALEYYPIPGFKYSDVGELLAHLPGEAEGPRWQWVLRTKDERYLFVQAGCDYTGFDCSGWIEATEAETPQAAAALGQNEPNFQLTNAAEQLSLQLSGERPYGVVHRIRNTRRAWNKCEVIEPDVE